MIGLTDVAEVKNYHYLLCLPRGVMEKSFLEYYDFYEVACKDRLHLQGQTMQVTTEPLLLAPETLQQTI